jgi:hypothetical protein
MKNCKNDIKKIIREYSSTESEEIANYNEDEYNKFQRLLPKMLKYFEKKFSSDIFYTEIDSDQKTYLASDNIVGKRIEFAFYFRELPDGYTNFNDLRSDIMKVIKDLFDIDWSRYGNPLNLYFYRIQWIKF